MKPNTKPHIVEGTFGPMMEIPDFLPAPSTLVLKTSQKKVTLTLDNRSILFFKQESKRLHTPYQRMIRNLLNEYVSRHSTVSSP